jgi:hypothetical protein
MSQDCLSRADREGPTSGEMSAQKLLMPGKRRLHRAEDPLARCGDKRACRRRCGSTGLSSLPGPVQSTWSAGLRLPTVGSERGVEMADQGGCRWPADATPWKGPGRSVPRGRSGPPFRARQAVNGMSAHGRLQLRRCMARGDSEMHVSSRRLSGRSRDLQPASHRMASRRRRLNCMSALPRRRRPGSVAPPAGVPRRPTPSPTTGRVNRPGISPFLPSIGSRQGVSFTDRWPCGRRAFRGNVDFEEREPELCRSRAEAVRP